MRIKIFHFCEYYFKFHINIQIHTVYRSRRVIPASWFGKYRTYTSKPTENIDKDGTNPVNIKPNSQSEDAATPAEKQLNSKELVDALESQVKKQLDIVECQNLKKLKELESRIKKIESRLNISRETREIGQTEQHLWVTIWICLLIFIIYKL